MTKITIAIYNYFHQHKVVFYALLVLSFSFFVYFGSKVKYEEDITKLLPSANKENNSGELVFANLKVKDKLFLVFKPTKETVERTEIIAACDDFMDSLMNNKAAADMITDVLYKMDGQFLQSGISVLYNHVPSFLDTTDYQMLDSLTTKESIQRQMQENLMTLYSPAGAAMKDVIAQDPLAFRNIFSKKMDEIKKGLGSNYKIVDQYFFTPDSAVAVAFVSPNFKTLDSKLSIKLLEIVEKEIEKLSITHPEIEVYFHGAAPQSVFNSRQIKKDLCVTLSISLFIVCFVICLCYKNKSTLLLLLTPILYGFFFALTIVYFTKGQLSLLALGIGAIVLGVALSYCLHIITHYKYVADPVKVLKDQTIPVILGCLTTIGAFMSLLFTKAELLKDFGIFASLSLAGTTIFCLIFLPQFFNPKKNKRSDKAFALFDKINSYPFERKSGLIAAIVVISIICLYTSRFVKFDSNITHISYYEPKVLQSQKILAEHTTKEYKTVYFAAVSESLDSALFYSNKMSDTFELLKNLDRIHSYSNNSQIFIPTDEQERRIKKWQSYWTDEKKKEVVSNMNEAAVQFGFIPEMFMPFSNMLENNFETISLIETGVIPSSIQSNMVEYTDGKYMVFTPVLLKEENKKEVCDEITAINHLVVIDPYYYTSDMVSLIHDDFSITLAISSIFVFIVLLFAYKSIILSLIAFMPMFLSWYIVQGIMGIFNIEFNLINIVISTFIFGIGVDYSIFVMDGLLSDFRTKRNLLVFHKTAILFSAFVLIVSVASLMFANHPAVKSIGVSTLIGMSTAVLIAYSLQPFLFYWVVKRPTCNKRAPLTIFNLMHGDLYFKKGKKMSKKQEIRNNYEYKDYEVERNLKSELRRTSNYRLFEELFPVTGKILDYGCGYGYKAYWFNLNNPEAETIGFDTNEEALLIANNCYLKNENIKFTSNPEILNENFEVVIINKKINDSVIDKKLEDCIQKAHYIIINKYVDEAAWLDKIKADYIEQGKDNKFILFKTKLFYK